MSRRRTAVIVVGAAAIAAVVGRRFRIETDAGPDVALDLPNPSTPSTSESVVDQPLTSATNGALVAEVVDGSGGAIDAADLVSNGASVAEATEAADLVTDSALADVTPGSPELDVSPVSIADASIGIPVAVVPEVVIPTAAANAEVDLNLAGFAAPHVDADVDLAGVAAPHVDADVDLAGVAAPHVDADVDLAGVSVPLADADLAGVSVPLADADSGLAGVSVPAAATEAAPAVVLPTMPRAGSHDVINPIVTVPSADGGVPAEVVTPAQSFAPAVGTAAHDAAATIADMPEFEFPTAPGAPATQITPALDASGPPTQSASHDGSGGNGPGGTPPTKRRGGWQIFSGILGALLVSAIIAAAFIKLPYYRLEPGSVYDTIERVEAPGDLVSIPDGEIGFVTVSQTANISVLEWLDAKLDDSVRIEHEDEIRGDQTADELREADLRRMQVSKNAAVVVALRKLGFDLVVTPLGVEVASVFDCTAADGTLGTGDLIVGVNGVDVRDGETLVEELIGIGIGQDVELLIERIDPNNPTQSIRTELVGLTLGSADDSCLPDDVRADEPRPFIGIGTQTIVEEDFPVDVDIRTGRVSGPSAGLAFTLAIIDVLSEGELTNGLNIVATGTIDRDGNVGPVGGIHQKTIAAERSGADVFIVPNCCNNFVDRDTNEPIEMPSNYEEALEHADDMIVIGVDTLDEALIAIGELGGDVDQFLPS